MSDSLTASAPAPPARSASPDVFNFVLCPSYHGATLLSCLLNNHSEITALGDTLPPRRLLDRAVCGCGQLVAECEFWQDLEARANPAQEYRDDLLLPLYPVVLENERANQTLMLALGLLSVHTSPALLKALTPQIESYVAQYERFYDAAMEMQGTSRFIDGQKSLLKLMVFIAAKGRENVRVIHLVRDPRAAYYSYVRRARAADPVKFGKEWKGSHGRVVRLAESLDEGSYFRLRYEDLCEDPDGHMNALQDFLDLDRQPLVRASTSAADKHVVGNVMVKSFNGEVRKDVRWQQNVPEAEQAAIVKASSPLFENLGYRA